MLGREIAVVYYRDGYMPDQYNEKTWVVREQLEMCKAIKCPNIFLQLVNTKYFQYVMTKKDTWLKFGFSEADFEANSKVFPTIFSTTDFKDLEKLKTYILENGGYKSWVMKPQREGGGNNFFGEDIEQYVNSHPLEDLKSFIFQKRIDMVTNTGVMTNWECSHVREVDYEIGLFHCIVSDKNQIIFQTVGGMSVNVKKSALNEAKDKGNYGAYTKALIVG